MAVFNLFKRFVNQNTEPSERRTDERLRAALGARVLVVDDSATIRAVLGKMLMQDGYEVLKAADGESAIEMAQSQFPDLIFLDIVLPGISGFAVLRTLRRDTRTRTTPIIMMSGNQQATEQFYVQRFGADGFVKKPFGRAEVFHSVRSLVQAGRMPARIEVAPVNAIPEGMTQEEWNAIPDVALPDNAPFTTSQTEVADSEVQSHSRAASAPVERHDAAEAKVPEPMSDDVQDAEVAESASTAMPEPGDSPGQPSQSHAGPDSKPRAAVSPVATGSWSMPASSLAMRPTLSSSLRAAMASASAVVLHVRLPKREDPSTATDTETPGNVEHVSDEDNS